MVVKDEYNFISNEIPIKIRIYTEKNEFVPIYEVSISSISKNTEIILEKIRQELINNNFKMTKGESFRKVGIEEWRYSR